LPENRVFPPLPVERREKNAPRYALFGGSFNPVHKAHLALARAARAELKLDRVFFVPARRPPHKSAALAPARHRVAMLRAALRGQKAATVDLWELRRPGVSYTHKTLAAFRRRWPRAHWTLLVGGDSAKDFESWRRWKWLLEHSDLVVGARRGVGGTGLRASVRRRAHVLKARLPKISASDVRRRVRGGDSISALVPPPVARYIRRHRLYRDRP